MTTDDEAAFRHFVATRGPALLRTARLLAGDAAEDLLQDALARLVPHWRRVGDPEAYVRTSLHRLAISRWRRRRWTPTPLEDDGLLASASPRAGGWPSGASGPAGADESVDRIVLRAALARLTARQRAVLVCRHVEDLSEADTARCLGVSVGTVRSTNHRALARLREVAPELAAFRGTPASSLTSPEAAP